MRDSAIFRWSDFRTIELFVRKSERGNLHINICYFCMWNNNIIHKNYYFCKDMLSGI